MYGGFIRFSWMAHRPGATVGAMNSTISRRSVRDAARIGVAGVALVAALAACGGTPASSAGATGGATATGAAAPEVNPGGDIPDNQVYVPVTAPDGSFTVSVPQGWAQTSQGGATVFSDKLDSVRIESGPQPTPPDVASARSRIVPALSASVPGFSLRDVTTVTRSAGPAVLITYDATSAPDPVTGRATAEAVERYTFWKGGEQVTLTLSGAQGADNVDPWRMVTDSFRWLR